MYRVVCLAGASLNFPMKTGQNFFKYHPMNKGSNHSLENGLPTGVIRTKVLVYEKGGVIKHIKAPGPSGRRSLSAVRLCNGS